MPEVTLRPVASNVQFRPVPRQGPPRLLTPTTPVRTGIVVVPGPRGPAGPAAQEYVHNQTTPAATWVIAHQLGRHPRVLTLVSGSDQAVWPDESYPSSSTVTLEFASPVAGTAYLS